MKFEDLMTETGLDVYRKITVRAWTDPAFKATLDSDPKRALAEFGVTGTDDITINTINNTPGVFNFVVAAAPAEGELSEDDLESAAGGCICP